MIEKKNIADIRREYSLKELDEQMVTASPFAMFQLWFNEVLEIAAMEPNAMCLSTATADGRPSARIVLLKGFDEQGFRFFSNYHSTKGRMIEANPQVSLTFFWPEIERQVRIEGVAQKVSSEESDAYFASRPRGSQLGAWVSEQSEVIPGRQYLETRMTETNDNFADKEIIRPPHWGGYLVVPDLIEFWQGRESRLHDRIVYTRSGENLWKTERLSP